MEKLKRKKYKMNNTEDTREYKILLDVVRQSYASVVWTHKIQEKQADIYSERKNFLETVNIIVATLTSCGVTSIVVNKDSFVLKLITFVLSFITVAITAYFKNVDLKSLQKQHKDAANNFIVIRNELLQVIADIHMRNENVKSLNDRYKSIMERLNKLYINAPIVSERAGKRAADAFAKEKGYSYKEEEIDRFLPPELRKSCM